jgi:serine/threonine protein kinase
MTRFLVVDDDCDLTRLISDWLSSLKHHVIVKHTGAEGRAALSAGNFDLVLLDWELPDANGPDLCREYRENGGRAPVLLLTGRGRLKDKEVGFEAGADDYLVKPFRPKELELRMKALMRRSISTEPVPSSENPSGHLHDAETRVDVSSAVQAETSSAAPPANLPGRYEITGMLGTGAMGVVFKAKDKLLKRTVAMKKLQQLTSRQSLERFTLEAQSIAQLSHPNIVSVFDFGVSEDRKPFFIMEYLDGTSLEKVLETEKHLKLNRALPIFIQICRALEHAHSKGVIHRDLKPSNLILQKDPDGQEYVKIVDFGIVKLIDRPDLQDQKITRHGQIFGSPHYMSPEQVLGHDLDQQTDVFSFGCIMYECVTGATAFQGENDFDSMQMRLTERPLPFDAIRPDFQLPGALQFIVFKMLEIDPANRYQSLTEVKLSLEQLQKLL